MKIRPLHDRILVKRLEEETKTSGGLFIPDSAKEKPIQAKVVAVGAGKRDKSFDVSLIVKNLFANQTPQARTWNTITPAVSRSFGIQFTGKL